MSRHFIVPVHSPGVAPFMIQKQKGGHYTDAMGRRYYKQKGGAFWNDVGNWFQKAHDWVKENKVLSKVGKALTGVHPAFGAAGTLAGTLGYGKRKNIRY